MAKRKGQKKKQVSAQTRVKLSQAAKKRRRGPKGSIYGGQFAGGLGSAGARHHYAMGPGPSPGGKKPMQKGEKWAGNVGGDISSEKLSSPYPGATSRELFNQAFAENKRRLINKGMTESDAHKEAVSKASLYAYARTGVMPDTADANLPVRVTRRNPDSDRARADRLIAGMVDKGAPAAEVKTPRKLLQELPPDYKKKLEDPNSDWRKQLGAGVTTTGSVSGTYYGSPGERDRANKFIRALAKGATPEQAMQSALQDNRGRTIAGGVSRADLAEGVKSRGSRRGMTSKTQNMQPRAGELTFGINMPHVSSSNELEKRFPGLTEQDYVKLQQEERETIFDQFAQNQAWAHETREARMKGSSRVEGPDRVSFFTTSFGYPNMSVPSDSLVGQYVIRRRKRMVQEAGIASGARLRGRFPEAVRDMHVVEFTTGTSVGTKGTAGLWHKTGWRAGSRKSKGYGKPIPVGSTVLRDATGAPIYDSEGNIRYTEGLTRGYNVGTEKQLGLGIYIG